MGFGVWGLGFGVRGSGGVWGFWGLRVWGMGFGLGGWAHRVNEFIDWGCKVSVEFRWGNCLVYFFGGGVKV